MEKIKLTPVTPDHAASVMRAAGMVDPGRQDTPESIARAGCAFELKAGGGDAVLVLKKRGSQLWVMGAAAVASKGLTPVCFEAIEAIARKSACCQVAFQTARPGLVRLAKKSGYRIAGFIMEKGV